jgi:ABC-type arginine transport system ATPase subunit
MSKILFRLRLKKQAAEAGARESLDRKKKKRGSELPPLQLSSGQIRRKHILMAER